MNDNLSDVPASLQFLQETPAKLSKLIEGLSDSQLRLRNSDGDFSVLENICHLRDLEREGYEPRIDRILTKPNPTLPDFDGGRIAAERNYNAEDPATALQEFTTTRLQNLQRLRAADAEQIQRTGTLEGVGLVTLARLTEMMREHDEGHLEDLRVIRQRTMKL